jgi:hypothetical protein
LSLLKEGRQQEIAFNCLKIKVQWQGRLIKRMTDAFKLD